MAALDAGRVTSIAAIAEVEGATRYFATRVICRTFPAPDLVRAMLDGARPPALTSDAHVQHVPLPIDWAQLPGFISA
ncbi:UNVERIFIED_CONTAM: hypothetical protein LK11_72805 [Mumia flava]